MARNYEVTVKALLAKSESLPEGHPEKEALQTRAFEMMASHGIKVALGEQNTGNKPAHYPVRFSGVYVNRQMSLFNVVAKHFNCRLIQVSPGYAEMFGYESDIDSVEFLYDLLENQMLAGLSRAVIPSYVHAKTFRTSWLNGFIVKISERLQEAKKNAEKKEDTPGTAVVLRDRSLAVNDAVKEKFPRLVKKTSTSRSYSAFAQGQEAGSRAQLNINPELK
jgi:hypothetical protein